jgi:cobaltochelatase CobN
LEKGRIEVNLVYIFGHMVNINTWSEVAELLKRDGINLQIFSQRQNAGEALKYLMNNDVDIFIGSLFHDLPCHGELIDASSRTRFRIGLGWEMPPGFSSFTGEQTAQFESYSGMSVKNCYNSIKFLVSCSGGRGEYKGPEKIRTHGIYHPNAPSVFECSEDYFQWLGDENPGKLTGTVVGLLCYQGQIMEKNCADIDGVVEGLEMHGFLPLCVYFGGMVNSSLPIEKRYPWLPCFSGPRFKPSVILNFLGGSLLAKPEDSLILCKLNVPVVQIIRLYNETLEEWEADRDDSGGGAGSVFSLAQPELSGVIEPSIVAASSPEIHRRTGLTYRRFVPIGERIDHLCARLKKLVTLQKISNKEKRLTIVLNNNPCKGVEATLGLAAGLDTFESLVLFMRALKAAGYHVTDIPSHGEALLNLFLEKKAISEFRWTTSDEIVQKGGVIHKTEKDEYDGYLESLPERARNRILEDWGGFPGEGMVYRDDGIEVLLVTGLIFGNVKVIIQPKRGCYGAKCNGEVCRILHDPELSPPPHWLATYKYIRDTSDAVVHFGTHGALEFLPGKRVALSGSCFPEISLGDLPNIYLYTMDAPGDGVVAKRRGRGTMVDHLTPVQRPVRMGEEFEDLEELIEEYRRSSDSGKGGRKNIIIEKIIPLMKKLHFVEDTYEGENFEETVSLISGQIARSKRSLSPEGLHILGTPPGKEGTATMLATIAIKDEDRRPSLGEIASWSENPSGDRFEDARNVIRSLLDEEGSHGPKAPKGFRDWCVNLRDRIAMCEREIPQLIKALNGEYIEAGLSASLYRGKTQTLPTGRNFYTSDLLALPTRAAWVAGKEMAENLLRKYLKDEEKFPKSVGVSLWSIDAFYSDGEVFCQILHLMGMKPRWSSTGRISGIEAFSLEELKMVYEGNTLQRPRIDVVIQTSSILRDMVPHFADLVDEAAVAAGELDEPHEMNFIRKHTDERIGELKKELSEKLSDSELKRMASYRVFSSAPGTYGGTGVGYAIDASAWETEKDLAETYVNCAGYACGSGNSGRFKRTAGAEMHKVYAKNLERLDVTYMRQYSAEYDLVDSGCYSGFLGGMAVASQVISGKKSRLYWSDINAESDLSVRELRDEINGVVRVKLFNKSWIENQKKNGYKGAGGVAGRVHNLFKWSATTKEVEKWVYDKVVETYIHNRENLDWLKKKNPYALEEITRRLLEAESRGLWEAETDLLKDVRETALMIEGEMEDIMEEVNGEFQGSKVEVMTSKDVEKWNNKWKTR